MSVGSEFTVYNGGGCCVGLSYGGREGEVLVTLKSGAIQVYNVSRVVIAVTVASTLLAVDS